MSVEEEKQKELQHLKNEDEILELDQLITEGIEAKIPFTFTYPNTSKKVGVLVRPLSTNEYQNAILTSRRLKTNFLVELTKIGTYKLDESEIPEDAIKKLPAGVVTKIATEINRISGIKMEVNSNDAQQLFDDLMGF